MQLLMDESASRQGFTLANPKKLGSITCVYSGMDYSRTGSNDIVVGREDGLIEVFDVDETGQLQQVSVCVCGGGGGVQVCSTNLCVCLCVCMRTGVQHQAAVCVHVCTGV